MTNSASGRVVTFGEVLLRFATPGVRLTVQCEALDMVVGRAEAKAAAGLQSLGNDVKMPKRLPSSPLGDKAGAAPGAAGVDTTHVGLYFLQRGAGLRPSSISYDRARSVIATSRADQFDFASALEGALPLHLSGITPALGPGGIALAQASVTAADAAGLPVCFDGNYRALLWDAWDSNPHEILNGLMQSATVMIGNHRDISLLLGKAFSGYGSDRRREDALAAFETFPRLQLIASTAWHVVSSGHHRIAARLDAREAAHPTSKVDMTGIVDRIDTGDAFAAGVRHKWLQGADLVATAQAQWAQTMLKDTTPGGMFLVGPGELEAFSADGGNVRR